MKIKIQQSAMALIDTKPERARIASAFKDMPSTQKKLNKLMDFIENGDWGKALKELESTWWNGYDQKIGCPRKEFIGLVTFIKGKRGFFGNGWFGYLELIYEMNTHRCKMIK